MCPTCHVPLDQSDSAEAQDIRMFIQQRHDAGWSEQRTRQALVDRFGTRILAAPPFQGFDMLAWLIPGVILLGGGTAAVGLAWTWARRRNPTAVAAEPPAPEPALVARIQADLEQLE
jgi:cytochrome c-type biogenesis protein CcmH/NrfF